MIQIESSGFSWFSILSLFLCHSAQVSFSHLCIYNFLLQMLRCNNHTFIYRKLITQRYPFRTNRQTHNYSLHFSSRVTLAFDIQFICMACHGVVCYCTVWSLLVFYPLPSYLTLRQLDNSTIIVFSNGQLNGQNLCVTDVYIIQITNAFHSISYGDIFWYR